jgi:GntR family transcriptional regulator
MAASGPKYLQIKDDLAAALATGTYPPDSKLPSEAELAGRYGVTRMTVRRAVEGLVVDGLVSRRHGAGTFVLAQAELSRPLNRVTSFTEDMRAQGYEVETRIVSREEITPPADVRSALHLDESALTVRLERVRLVNGEPVAIQRSWVPLGRCPGLARDELVDGSLYVTFKSVYGIQIKKARQEITATVADQQQANLLRLPLRSPLLEGRRTTFDDNNGPIEVAETWTRPDIPVTIELNN